ncbi:MAG: DUF3078 domain-containing protein [Bacteroidetes bacterium]|nr:MAG: DUF3078 domain-containing protein [Bacteroidota bacterium]
MNPKLTLLFVLFLGFATGLQAQAEGDSIRWKRGGVASLGFTNAGYSDFWQAGGIPAQSVIGRINMFGNYKDSKQSWQNDLAFAYGLARQGSSENPFIKNEDRIELNSKYGYNFSKQLLISSQLNFRTQFAPGFKFNKNQPTTIPEDTISDFFAPAYLNFGVGVDYQPAENISVYYTPVNSKMTIVTIDEYRPIYIPQEITTGAVRYELGSNLTLKYRKEVAKNINFQTTANFFANYLENFGNVDVNWETLTTAKVNSWLAINFSTNLIYDDDIKFVVVQDDPATPNFNEERSGPRTQFQHILTVGLTYTFLQ